MISPCTWSEFGSKHIPMTLGFMSIPTKTKLSWSFPQKKPPKSLLVFKSALCKHFSKSSTFFLFARQGKRIVELLLSSLSRICETVLRYSFDFTENELPVSRISM